MTKTLDYTPIAQELMVGRVAHYFPQAGVAIIDLMDDIAVGDAVHISGATTDFEEKVSSLQRDHVDIRSASRGETVGIKVSQRVREGDRVYRRDAADWMWHAPPEEEEERGDRF